MKLNATAEMMPITWPGFSKIHPFSPVEQAQGYRELFDQLESALREITGFAAISLQPNAGSPSEGGADVDSERIVNADADSLLEIANELL